MNFLEELSSSNGVDREINDGSFGSHGCIHLKSLLSYVDYTSPQNSPLCSTQYTEQNRSDDGSGTRPSSLSPPNNDHKNQHSHFHPMKNSIRTFQEEIADRAQLHVFETATDLSTSPFDDHFFSQSSRLSNDGAENTLGEFVLDKNDNSLSGQDYSKTYGVASDFEQMPVSKNGFYPAVTALQQHQLLKNTPLNNPKQEWFTSNQYRSFSNELNSPELPLADDFVIDYEFPFSFGIECGFDNFLQPTLTESSNTTRSGTRGSNKQNDFQTKTSNFEPNSLQNLMFEDCNPSNTFSHEAATSYGFPFKEDCVISRATNHHLAEPFLQQICQPFYVYNNNSSNLQPGPLTLHGSPQTTFKDQSLNDREVFPTPVSSYHQTRNDWHQGSLHCSTLCAKPVCHPTQGYCHTFEPGVSVSSPDSKLFRNRWYESHNYHIPDCENEIQIDGSCSAFDPNPLLVGREPDTLLSNDQSSPVTGQRALITFMQERGFSTPVMERNNSRDIIVSAMDHIMQNRPPGDLFPTAREILRDSFSKMKATRLLHETMSDDWEKLFDDATDKGNGEEGLTKKRKVTDIKSEDILPRPWSRSIHSEPSGSPSSFEGVECQCDRSLNKSPTDSSGSPVLSSSSPKSEKRRPSVLPPCRVCNSKASGLHYGVVTCEACNGFFRRSLKRGAIYLCSKDRQCDVKGKRRGECSYCRYQRCLAVGMSKTAVKTGRYSDKTRLAYAIETENQNKNNLPVEGGSRLDTMTSELIKFHEHHLLHPGRVPDVESFERQCNCRNHKLNSSPVHVIDSVTRITSLLKDIPGVPVTRTFADKSETGFSKIMAGFLENWLRHYVKFIKHIPGFSLLRLNDQTSLIKATWHEIWLLGAYKGFHSEMDVMANPNGASLHYYDEIKLVFGKVYADMSYKLFSQMNKLKVTPEELVLIKMMCMTYAERRRLEKPDQVRSLHWLVTQCLVRELKKTHPDEPNVFSEIVACLGELRAALHESMLPGNGFMYKHNLNNETPLLKEILT